MNLLFYHMPNVFYWIQSWWPRKPLKNTNLIFMLLKPVKMLCDLVRYHAGSRHSKLGKMWLRKHAHGQQQYLNRLWHSSDDWLLKHAKQTFPTAIHHPHQPGLYTQGRLDWWIRVIGAMFWSHHLCALADIHQIHQTRLVVPVLNSAVLVSLCPLQPQLVILGWKKWHPMWTSTVLANLAQWLMLFCLLQLYRVAIGISVAFLSVRTSLAILG